MPESPEAAAEPACPVQPGPQRVAVCGAWTALKLGEMENTVEKLAAPADNLLQALGRFSLAAGRRALAVLALAPGAGWSLRCRC